MEKKTEFGSEFIGIPMETIADRLRSLVPDRQKSESARKCGIAQKTFSSYLEGTEPTATKLVQLASGLGVSLLWLATGEGPQFPDQAAVVADNTASVPRLDVVASAGPGASGALEKTLEMVPFPRAFLRSIGVSPAHANIVTVAGDSMEPTLSAGDDLIVDTAVKRIRAEALYVLILDGEVVVKRAQRRINGSILITSDNERYPPEEVTPDEADKLHVAGRVVWFGRSI